MFSKKKPVIDSKKLKKIYPDVKTILAPIPKTLKNTKRKSNLYQYYAKLGY
jgi:hypothetical protein